MQAQDLLQQLHQRGFRLWADGDRLLVEPGARLTDETRALIRAHKKQLWEFLTHQQAATCWERFKASADSIISLQTWEARKEALSRYRDEHGESAAKEMWLWLVHRHGRPTVMDS